MNKKERINENIKKKYNSKKIKSNDLKKVRLD